MNRNQITPEAALLMLARLRADPSVLGPVRPLVASTVASLMAVDTDALSETERALWLDTTRRTLDMADLLAAVDVPAPSERTN